MKYCLILVIVFKGVTLGFSQSKVTQVVAFNYGGFSDTTLALLKINSNLSELGLKIYQNDSLFIDTTVSQSQLIGFNYGHWDLIFFKKGYDSIFIKDYFAVPDQVSNVRLFVAKGNQRIKFKTNPPVYLFPKNGTDSTFFENGQLKTISTYRNNSLIYQMEYFHNGSVKYKKENLDNGLTSAIEFYENGQIKFIAFWNKITTEGYRKEFFADGRLKEHLLNTDDGQLTWFLADSTGTPMIEKGNTLMNYRIEHQLDTITNFYRGGLKDGVWIYKYSNGNILWKEVYNNGKKVLFEYYSEAGILYKREEY